MKVLVTGADGFVGCWLTRRLLHDGHDVYGAIRMGEETRNDCLSPAEQGAVRWLPLELTDDASVRRYVDLPYDAVVHLAAQASVTRGEQHPGRTWHENAAGTARISSVLGRAKAAGEAEPMLLLVSSVEVYGPGVAAPRKETDPVAPVSAYATSKLGAEIAALAEWRRTGLRVLVARPSPHTGRGQNERAFVPKYARRIIAAK